MKHAFGIVTMTSNGISRGVSMMSNESSLPGKIYYVRPCHFKEAHKEVMTGQSFLT